MTNTDKLKAMFPNATDEFLKLNAQDAPARASDRVSAKEDELLSPEVLTRTVRNLEALKGKANKRYAIIIMHYPGGFIAENNCYEGFGKHRHMKPEARQWQEEFIAKIQTCSVNDWKSPIKVSIGGIFQDNRRRIDLHNLKLVYDGIQMATGINDRDFYTETSPGQIDKSREPHLMITIREV
jgi:hypothetical protein